ncbi:hypothetical protein, partial [Lactobacillus delbrueckii]|uniref:hypothetical protein n=2 Tax=Lactobacillus delbrueckii TaxID=1584 RepID=UPI0021A315CA
LTPNLTAFTGVDSQNLPDVMVSVQFILAIGVFIFFEEYFHILVKEKNPADAGFFCLLDFRSLRT